MNDLPRLLPELLAVVGVLYFDEWPEESASHALIRFRAVKANGLSGKWILPDVQDLVTFICNAENEVIEKQSTSEIDYKKIFTEMRPCALESIVELWQVRYLLENEPEIFKGAKRFYKKLCSPHTDAEARKGMELKLHEILSIAEHRYYSHKNSPKALKLDSRKVMNHVYESFRSIVSTHKKKDLSFSRNVGPRIGLGLQSGYKRNSLVKEVQLDASTTSKYPTRGHRLYTPGWSADGHFADDKE